MRIAWPDAFRIAVAVVTLEIALRLTVATAGCTMIGGLEVLRKLAE